MREIKLKKVEKKRKGTYLKTNGAGRAQTRKLEVLLYVPLAGLL